jgi:hypothetical protein
MKGSSFLAEVIALTAGSGIAQQPNASPEQTPVSVPFVGCQSDGQAGPVKAPSGKAAAVQLRAELAQRLAYYSSAEDLGVLAPRGGYCFGTYGSGGEHVFVSPQPVDAKKLFSEDWSGFLGAAVQLDHSFGDTSGRFNVAEIIARVFPAYRWFAMSVAKELSPPDKFSFGPDPEEVVTYKSKTVVEYRTPAQTDGLGTHFWLKKNDSAIEGVAILVEQAPDSLLLAVRLPHELAGLTSAIIRQVEREAERRPQPQSVHQ